MGWLGTSSLKTVELAPVGREGVSPANLSGKRVLAEGTANAKPLKQEHTGVPGRLCSWSEWGVEGSEQWGREAALRSGLGWWIVCCVNGRPLGGSEQWSDMDWLKFQEYRSGCCVESITCWTKSGEKRRSTKIGESWWWPWHKKMVEGEVVISDCFLDIFQKDGWQDFLLKNLCVF